MANIAEGFITISSQDKALLDNLRERMKGGPFSYAESADLDAYGKKANELNVAFTCRWTCDPAWEFFSKLIRDESYNHRSALIEAVIIGEGSEEALDYSSKISKQSGDDFLTVNGEIMKVSICVYTTDLEASLEAYRVAIESGAIDVALSSSHEWESKELEYFNLQFQADHTNTAISHLDHGPFRIDTDFD